MDSPHIVLTLFVLGMVLVIVGHALSFAWRWIAYGIGAYFLLGAIGMLFYSKVGKLRLRDRLLDHVHWRGDEKVLDVGCGRGLVAIAAAHRVPKGSVIAMDVWNPTALSGNRANSVIQNAQIEGVANRVEIKQGDARELPFPAATFDVVVSNYVVHELKSRQDRERMMQEVARVLKPNGQLAVVDFIFTNDCVSDLSKLGMESQRVRDGFLSFFISAILNFGAVKTYTVVGRKT